MATNTTTNTRTEENENPHLSPMPRNDHIERVSLAHAAATQISGLIKERTDATLANLGTFVRDVERRSSACELDIGVLKSEVGDIKGNSIERFAAQREAVSLALAAAKETTKIAQDTADKAVAKAEAAAGKEYLESQIEGLRSSFTAQIIAQKEAINAALVAAKDALTAALASAEKAIAKAEQASDKRFESVNEFRQSLSDQTGTFIARNEYSVQYSAIADRLTSLEKSRSEMLGKTSVSDPAVSEGLIRLKEMVVDLIKSRDTTTGHSQGIGQSWGVLLGAAGIVTSFVTLAVMLTRTIH